MRGLVNRKFLASENYQNQQLRAVREGASPLLLEFERVMVHRMKRLGIPMFASEVIRTAERQNDLYALGNSRAKGGQSPHQHGLAVDIVHSVRGWALDRKEWDLVIHVGFQTANSLSIKVVNGSTFTGLYDPAHWELEGWRADKARYPWPPFPRSSRERALVLQDERKAKRGA